MFKFGKQKNKLTKEEISQQGEVNIDDLIHVMPTRFYTQPKKNRLGLIVIIVLSFLIICGLAIAGYFLNENLKQKRLAANNNSDQIADDSNNQNVNQSDDDLNANDNQDDSSNTNSNTNGSTTTDDIIPDPTDPVVDVDQIVSADSDSDGLTNLEEQLFGTNSDSNDSDGDGYYDEAEILSGYDPTSPSLTLGASGIFNSYNHQNYSISYPRKWTLREQDEDNNEVLFISDVGEFIEVLVIPNSKNLAIEDWFLELLPNVNVLPSSYVTVNNAVGVRVDEGKTYYLLDSADNSRVFILTYNTGSSNIYNFETTFGVMVNSFRIIK